MRRTLFALLALGGAIGLGLLSCSDENGADVDAGCKTETVAGLAAYLSERDDADFCVVIEGVLSFGSTNACPGGYFLKDSVHAPDSIYLQLDGYTIDQERYPEVDSITTPARVVADFRPGEQLCSELLCHCQQKLWVKQIRKP